MALAASSCCPLTRRLPLRRLFHGLPRPLTVPEPDEPGYVKDQTGFSLWLSRHVGSRHATGDNLAFSPLSVHSVLSMIAAGSSGPVRDQALSFLRAAGGDGGLRQLNAFASETVAGVLADGSERGGPKLNWGNSAWLDKHCRLKPTFENTITTLYRAQVQYLDMVNNPGTASQAINSWIEDVTAGRMKNPISPQYFDLPSSPPKASDPLSLLVLCNAIYFKGLWGKKFDKSRTRDDEFSLLDGRSVQVPFINDWGSSYFAASYDGFKVLRLPYKQGRDSRRFSMYIFLPDARDGLWNLAERLSSEDGFFDRHLPQRKQELGELRIPKIKIKFSFEAKGLLKDLGLVLPFDPDGRVTEMVYSPAGERAFVSQFIHQCLVEVDEEGTTAAAFSAATFGCAPRRIDMDFVADHPFLFMIREDVTGVLLFTGHVLNPSL